MSLHDAMLEACAAVRIVPPRHVQPGRWSYTDTMESNGKGDGRVLIFDDGNGGICWNWQTQISQVFSLRGNGDTTAASLRRDPAKERKREAQRQEVARICEAMVYACSVEPHPYLVAKGFPDERGLVLEKPAHFLPRSELGERIRYALPETDEPVLLVPGRIDGRVATVQLITADGDKKNIFGGQMGGAAHRIASGQATWVVEGIATAHSVRAALRLLGRSATVLSAFAASNVLRVAQSNPGASIAADHDKPVEAFGGLGTGEYYAIKSGHHWLMPPERGDFNDMHQRDGLRAVAKFLLGAGT